jgi:flagellar basal-body rod modification protein FlgD
MPTSVSGLDRTSSVGLSSASTTGSNALDKDAFLKLLLAQLANQDPLSPTNNQEFIGQLAQFSSLEQVQATNSRLDSLLLAQASANQTAASSFIGKDVLYRTSDVALTETGGKIVARSSASASTLTATITDAKGKVVRTISLQDVPAGPLTIPWDGLSDTGVKLPNGTYSVQVEAKDARGQAVTVQPEGRAKVTGVTFSEGYPQLIVNDLPINMSDVIEVSDPKAA